MSFRPAPQEERWILVAAHLRLRRNAPGIAERCGDWTAAPPLARCAFFVLGALAAGLTALIFNLSPFQLICSSQDWVWRRPQSGSS
jgi:hypothetical protein